MDNTVIQSFWIGPFSRDSKGSLLDSHWESPEIDLMSKMAMKSFMAHGHEFHLYTYHKVLGIPKGVVVKDANEIVPITATDHFRGPAQFYDYFSYQLLSQRGGWTVGMDVICLQHFDFVEQYVFAVDDIDHLYITNTAVKCPAGSKIMEDCCAEICRMDTLNLASWSETGPILLHQQVMRKGLFPFVHHGNTFDLVPYTRLPEIVDPGVVWDDKGAYCIHLRNSIWNNGPNSGAGRLPNGEQLNSETQYHPESLWEKLKRQYA